MVIPLNLPNHTMKKASSRPPAKTARKAPGRAKNKPATSKPPSVELNPKHHANAAGIDIGARESTAALPPGRNPGGQDVRTFAMFTSDIHALRDWLVANSIDTVAIESTGNYWITLYDVLAEAGINVFLVNARHVKGVPGKKTDVQDAQWLQQLHAAGLLKKSFRPQPATARLRYLMRHRGELVADAAKCLQLKQKVLTEMNLKLHHVFSDIDGVSALAIMDAIIAGERRPEVLADLRDRRCRSAKATVVAALEGDYREEYIMVLQQLRQQWQRLQEDIAKCDQKLEQLVGQQPKATMAALPPPIKKDQHKIRKNCPRIDIFQQSWEIYGVDLSTVPGVSGGLLSSLISEVGTREQMLEAFPASGHFCSWLGLCPDNRVSGGKVLKAKTRKVVHRLAGQFRLSAYGLTSEKSRLGSYVWQMKARLGKAEGITAVAHKLARIVYGMILHQTGYDEQTAFRTTPLSEAKRLARATKLAEEMGMKLVPKEAA